MNEKNLEDLLVAAASNSSVKTLESLLNELRTSGKLGDSGIMEKLDSLLDSWDDDLTVAQASFCMELCALSIADSASRRRSVAAAVKVLLPPYLNKAGFVRAIGARDQAVPLRDVARRFRNLLQLKTGMTVFIGSTARWGVINNIDPVSGQVTIRGLHGTSSASLTLPAVLNDAKLFNPGPDVQKLSDNLRRPSISGADYRRIASAKCLSILSAEDIHRMTMSTLTPAIFSPEEFKTWYESEDKSACNAASQSGARNASHARSLQEMLLMLQKEAEGPKVPAFSEENIKAFTLFFNNLKQAVINREVLVLAQVMVLLRDRMTDEELKTIFAELPAKTPFLPENPMTVPLDVFAVYGDLNVKALDKLFDIILLLMSEEYVSKLATRLPLKSLNILGEKLSPEGLNAVFHQPGAGSSSDLLLWIWKNRKKNSQEFLPLVNLQSVVRALNMGKLPKAWGAAQRELKNQLLDKADFQQQLVDNVDSTRAITNALQGALFFTSGEQQSMLAKFSRLSKDLREHLESGAGLKLLDAEQKKAAANAARNEMLYTSVKAHQRLIKELDDIINIHMPENREALKTARAHGDFRENSEFDAAKERRNFLSRRRSELERELSRVQGVSFKDIAVDKTAVVGCTVKLAFDNGTEEIYYLLGAWDGDPDKKYLSYKTRLGEAIFGQEVGARLKLPGTREAVLAEVSELQESVLADME